YSVLQGTDPHGRCRRHTRRLERVFQLRADRRDYPYRRDGQFHQPLQQRPRAEARRMILAGIHPVLEALRAGRPLERVLVAKAAAGALEHLPVVRVGNLNRALDEVKQRGFAVYGIDERGDIDYHRLNYALPAALVLGGEGKGIHEMVRKRCDAVIRIPMAGNISSLNVSVAGGIVLFDWKRRQPTSA